MFCSHAWQKEIPAGRGGVHRLWAPRLGRCASDPSRRNGVCRSFRRQKIGSRNLRLPDRHAGHSLKFILGLTTPGLIMLLVTVLTCGAGALPMWIIGLIEGVIYLTKSDEEFYETYAVQKAAAGFEKERGDDDRRESCNRRSSPANESENVEQPAGQRPRSLPSAYCCYAAIRSVVTWALMPSMNSSKIRRSSAEAGTSLSG